MISNLVQLLACYVVGLRRKLSVVVRYRHRITRVSLCHLLFQAAQAKSHRLLAVKGHLHCRFTQIKKLRTKPRTPMYSAFVSVDSDSTRLSSSPPKNDTRTLDYKGRPTRLRC